MKIDLDLIAIENADLLLFIFQFTTLSLLDCFWNDLCVQTVGNTFVSFIGNTLKIDTLFIL